MLGIVLLGKKEKKNSGMRGRGEGEKRDELQLFEQAQMVGKVFFLCNFYIPSEFK